MTTRRPAHPLLPAALFAVSFLLGGCNRSKGTAAVIAPPPAFQPMAENAMKPEDHSLAADQYGKLGLPDVNHAWSSAEMNQAAKALVEIASHDAAQLPRYHSARSGTVFARLTAPQNLDALRDESRKFDDRFQETLGDFQAANAILPLYIEGMNQKKSGDSELIDVMGLEFRVAATLVTLVDQIIPTIKPGAADYATRMAGLEKMKSGLATMAMGGLQSLTERDTYRAGERLRLVGFMTETYPTIVSRLSATGQHDALARLDSLSADKHLKELQPALDQLRTAVRNGVVRASTM